MPNGSGFRLSLGPSEWACAPSFQTLSETKNIQVARFIRNNTRKRRVQARRLSRWQTLLSYYNFKIVHIKGTDNFLADFLSMNV